MQKLLVVGALMVAFGALVLPAFTAVTTPTETISAVLESQREAWNRGDLDGFMSAYSDSPDISYICEGKEVRGYAPLRDRYVKRYGTARDTMGFLSFTNLKVCELGPQNALCTGNWQVLLKNERTVEGMFSLVLTQTSKGWKIIHDHTSSLPAKTH